MKIITFSFTFSKKGLQEEREKKEQQLVALQKNVNERRQKVSYKMLVSWTGLYTLLLELQFRVALSLCKISWSDRKCHWQVVRWYLANI